MKNFAKIFLGVGLLLLFTSPISYFFSAGPLIAGMTTIMYEGKPVGTPDPGALSWERQPWWAQWEREHKAVREGAILMDMSFMSKFLVEGRDAGTALNWLSANQVDGPANTITYTQWLDEAGKLQADLTVAKLDEDRFWVVASDTAHRGSPDANYSLNCAIIVKQVDAGTRAKTSINELLRGD